MTTGEQKSIGSGSDFQFLLASPMTFLVGSWQEALEIINTGSWLTMATWDMVAWLHDSGHNVAKFQFHGSNRAQILSTFCKIAHLMCVDSKIVLLRQLVLLIEDYKQTNWRILVACRFQLFCISGFHNIPPYLAVLYFSGLLGFFACYAYLFNMSPSIMVLVQSNFCIYNKIFDQSWHQIIKTLIEPYIMLF